MKIKELCHSNFDDNMVPAEGASIGDLAMRCFTLGRYRPLIAAHESLQSCYKLFVKRPSAKDANFFNNDIATYAQTGTAPYVLMGNDTELRVAALFLNAVYDNKAFMKFLGAAEQLNLTELNKFYIPLSGSLYRYAALLMSYKLLVDVLVETEADELDKTKYVVIQQYLRLVRHYYVLEAYLPQVFRKNNISIIGSWGELMDMAIDESVDNNVAADSEITAEQVLKIFGYIVSNRAGMMETINKLKVLQFDF